MSRETVSKVTKAAAGLPSRGCPTEPTTASHWRPRSSWTGTPAIGTKLVILAVTDIVAEADHPLRAARPRGVEAGAEGLPVGMDIRKNSQQHANPPGLMVAPWRHRGLSSIKQHEPAGDQLNFSLKEIRLHRQRP